MPAGLVVIFGELMLQIQADESMRDAQIASVPYMAAAARQAFLDTLQEQAGHERASATASEGQMENVLKGMGIGVEIVKRSQG